MRNWKLQERRAEARTVRVDCHRADALRVYGDLFQRLDDLICAKRMMDDEAFLQGAESAEAVIRLAREHVTNGGFPLPPAIISRLREWVDKECLSEVQDREWWVMELLKIAVGGLDRGFKLQAWGIIETWQRDQILPKDRLELAVGFLKMARNDR